MSLQQLPTTVPIDPMALAGALASVSGVRTLSCAGGLGSPPPVSLGHAVRAAGRFSDLVIIDLPRGQLDALPALLREGTRVVLLVPLRMSAALSAVAVLAALRMSGIPAEDVVLLARQTPGAGLGAAELSRGLGLPVSATVPVEDSLESRMARGRPVIGGRGPLSVFCRDYLDQLDHSWAAGPRTDEAWVPEPWSAEGWAAGSWSAEPQAETADRRRPDTAPAVRPRSAVAPPRRNRPLDRLAEPA